MPYNGDTAKGQREGYVVDIVRGALASHGHKLEYVVSPWDRTMQMMEDGTVDCTYVGLELPDYPRSEEPVGLCKTAVWVLKRGKFKNWRYESTASLDALDRLGIPQGWVWFDDIQKYIDDEKNRGRIKFFTGNDATERAMRMLGMQRIDMYIEVEDVFVPKAASMNMSDTFSIAGYTSEPVYLYMACSKKNKKSRHYIDLVDREIRRMRESGELRVILDSYGLKDWKIAHNPK